MHSRSPFARPIPLLVLLTLVPLGANAGAEEKGWRLRAGFLWNDPAFSVEGTDSEEHVRARAQPGLGLGAAVEYRLSPRLGVELGLLTAEDDVEVEVLDLASGWRLEAEEGLQFTVFSAGLNLYLTPNSRVDLYFGPLVGKVYYDDLTLTGRVTNLPVRIEETVRIEVEDDLAVGAVLGLDVPIGRGRWAFNAHAKYLDTDLDTVDEEGDRESFSFDPLILGAGFTLRL